MEIGSVDSKTALSSIFSLNDPNEMRMVYAVPYAIPVIFIILPGSFREMINCLTTNDKQTDKKKIDYKNIIAHLAVTRKL